MRWPDRHPSLGPLPPEAPPVCEFFRHLPDALERDEFALVYQPIVSFWAIRSPRFSSVRTNHDVLAQ